MKNKKLLTLLVIVLLGTLSLTACDGTLPEDLNLEEYLQDGTSLSNPNDDDINDDMNDDSDDEIDDDYNDDDYDDVDYDDDDYDDDHDEDMNDDSDDDMYDDHDDDDDSSEHGKEIEIKAAVTAVTADSITIDGETFTVKTSKDLTTLFTVGEIFEIEYYLNADGSITLTEYHLEDDMDDDDDYDDDDYDDDDYDNDDYDNDDYDDDDHDDNHDNDDNDDDDEEDEEDEENDD